MGKKSQKKDLDNGKDRVRPGPRKSPALSEDRKTEIVNRLIQKIKGLS